MIMAPILLGMEDVGAASAMFIILLSVVKANELICYAFLPTGCPSLIWSIHILAIVPKLALCKRVTFMG